MAARVPREESFGAVSVGLGGHGMGHDLTLRIFKILQLWTCTYCNA